MMKKQKLASIALMSALLAGCSLIPNYERPATQIPSSWSETNPSDSAKIARNWWAEFQSAELNNLMEQALIGNHDINAAIARVEQARGILRSSSSSLLPSLDGTASLNQENINPGRGKSTNDVGGTAGLQLSYELDLFGLNRAGIASDRAELLASAYARDALSLIVMGDVAKSYFNVLNLKERLRIADENLNSARELLRIVQARYDVGAISQLDVSQQKSELASSEASRATVENQMKIAQSALAVLVGVPPQNLSVAGDNLRGLEVPAIAPGQPSSLLERRPDIRQAEANLVAANADIGAARAAFFPQITLGVGASIGATPIGDPATTIVSFGSSLLAPIFNAGRLQGNLDTVNARQLELVQNYQKNILVSFKEVEDALSTVKASAIREGALLTAMDEARNAYNLSQQQYDAGAIDFQVLLDARRTFLAREDAYVTTKNERLSAAVDLFKSLGGGWYENVRNVPAADNIAPIEDTAPQPLAPTEEIPTSGNRV